MDLTVLRLCDINLLREVVLNENGFEDLALLPRHKKLLKALVSTVCHLNLCEL